MTNYGDHNHNMRVRGFLIIAVLLLIASLATNCAGCPYSPRTPDNNVATYEAVPGEIAEYFRAKGHACESWMADGDVHGHVDGVPFVVTCGFWRSYPEMSVAPIVELLDDWLAFELAAREAGKR